MKKILVGTDTTASADLAVRDAAELARARGAELLVLYVAPEGELRAVVDPGKAAIAALPGGTTTGVGNVELPTLNVTRLTLGRGECRK